MSTPPPGTTLPTRQQLDEIDALLRRMLALPPLAGETAEKPGAAQAPALTPAIREVPAARPAAPGEPVVQAWRVEWPATAPAAASVVSWGTPVVPPAAETSAPVAPPSAPTPAALTPAVLRQPTAVPQPASAVPAALWPLILLNGLFDILSYLLGPLGTWLRGPGRTVLGLLGIGMLLAAGVWTAGEWYGYEWPRDILSQLAGRLGLAR
ncbi:MAG TPA: hypothetical protein VKE40_18445 [Gemmataceae bacterium]|nr:hypothetical protein [Gemmataceae bacterium]